MKGTLGYDYHRNRKNKRALSYRLRKRTEKVLAAIDSCFPNPSKILDLGTADGLMLGKIKDRFPDCECWGVEYSSELIKANQDKRLKIIQADVLNLPDQIKKQKFDVIIAAALIEHLKEPKKMPAVVDEILAEKGVLIITTPVPFFEKLASKVGHLSSADQHWQTFTLRKIETLFWGYKFHLLKKEKFMFSPIGFPFEKRIESMMRKIKLEFLMANQLVVFGH